MNKNNKDLNTLDRYFDDDPTSELPVLTDRAGAVMVAAGVDDTSRSPILRLTETGLTNLSEPASQDPRSLSIHRLEREVERLQANWIDIEDELRERDNDIERLGHELADREAAVAQLEEQLTEAEQNRQKLEARSDALDSELAKRAADLDDATKQLAATRVELQTARQQLDATREQLDNLRAEADQIRAASAQLETDQAGIQADHASLTHQLADLQGYIEGRKPRWDAQEKELSTLRATIAAKDRQLERRSAEQQELRTRLADEQARAEGLAEQLEQTREYADGLQGAVTELETRCEQTTASLLVAQQEHQALAAQLQTGITDQQQSSEQLSAKLGSAREEIASLTGRLETEQTLLATTRDELEQAKTQLQSQLDASEESNKALGREVDDLRNATDELARLRAAHAALQSSVEDSDAAQERLHQQIAEIDAQRNELSQLLAERDQQVHNLEKELRENLKVMREIGRSGGTGIAAATDAPRLTERAVDHLENSTSGRLLVAISDERGTRFSLDKPVMIIGRGADADIQIRKKYISRRHARLVSDDTGVRIEDLDSKNGVMIDSRRVLSSQVLHDGDIINIGEFKLSFVDPASQGAPAAHSHG